MNRIKLIISNLALALLLVGSFSGVAQAHDLQQNNGMSVVLHGSPDDNPIAGQPSKLNVSFANKPATFALANCDCQFAIALGGKVIQSAKPEPALPGATLQGSSVFTFPKTGSYKFIASGTATDGSFAPFKIVYNVHVTRGIGAAAPVATKKSFNSASFVIGAGSFAIIAFMAYVSIGGGGRYTAAQDPVSNRKITTTKKASKV